jgi:hypothetical protein
VTVITTQFPLTSPALASVSDAGGVGLRGCRRHRVPRLRASTISRERNRSEPRLNLPGIGVFIEWVFRSTGIRTWPSAIPRADMHRCLALDLDLQVEMAMFGHPRQLGDAPQRLRAANPRDSAISDGGTRCRSGNRADQLESLAEGDSWQI